MTKSRRFCGDCGHRAEGAFCGNCGARTAAYGVAVEQYKPPPPPKLVLGAPKLAPRGPSEPAVSPEVTGELTGEPDAPSPPEQTMPAPGGVSLARRPRTEPARVAPPEAGKSGRTVPEGEG